VGSTLSSLLSLPYVLLLVLLYSLLNVSKIMTVHSELDALKEDDMSNMLERLEAPTKAEDEAALQTMKDILEKELPVVSTFGGQNLFYEKKQHYVRPPDELRTSIPHTQRVSLMVFLTFLEHDKPYIWVIDKYGDLYVCQEYIHYSMFPSVVCPYCQGYVRQDIARKRSDAKGMVQLKHGDLMPATTVSTNNDSDGHETHTQLEAPDRISTTEVKTDQATEDSPVDDETSPGQDTPVSPLLLSLSGKPKILQFLPNTKADTDEENKERTDHDTQVQHPLSSVPIIETRSTPESGSSTTGPSYKITREMRSNSDPGILSNPSRSKSVTHTPPLTYVSKGIRRIPSKNSLRFDRLKTFHPKSCFHGEFRGTSRAGGEMILRRDGETLLFELNSRSGYSLNQVLTTDPVPIPTTKGRIRALKGEGREVDYEVLGEYLSLMLPGFPAKGWTKTFFQKKDHRKYYRKVELRLKSEDVEKVRLSRGDRWRTGNFLNSEKKQNVIIDG